LARHPTPHCRSAWVRHTDVVPQVYLSGRVARGSHRLTGTDRSETDSAYQIVFHYYVSDERKDQGDEGPLAIRQDYDRSSLTVDDVVTAKATVENRGPKFAPMVVLDLPIPGGFTLERDSPDRLVAEGDVARYQVTTRSAIVNLRGQAPGRPLVLPHRLRALMLARVTVPSARVYEYYDPDRRGSSRPGQLSVAPRPSGRAGSSELLSGPARRNRRDSATAATLSCRRFALTDPKMT
jgi:hypothetical protein